MAKVKNFTGKDNVPLITEDPRPEVSGFYFYGERHDKASLAPVFDTAINYGPEGSYGPGSPSGFVYGTPGNGGATAPAGRHAAGILQLSKQTVSVSRVAPSQGSDNTNNPYDIGAMWSMDSTYQPGNTYRITNGTFTTVIATRSSVDSTSTWYYRGWPALNSSQQLHDVSAGQGSNLSYCYVMHFLPTPINGYVSGVVSYGTSSLYHYPEYRWAGLGPSWPGNYNSLYYSGTNLSSYQTCQFLGTSSVDQNPLWVVSHRQNVNFSVQKVRWETSSPTVTQMSSITATPAASGTSAGGNWANSRRADKFLSNWFVDPRDVTNNSRCFYYPYFDINLNYHPFVFVWNSTNDTFTRETDITIASGGRSNTDQAVDISALSSGDMTYVANFVWNKTFVLSGVRYLTVGFCDNRDQFSTNASMRTFITYIVNASNPKLLTYHSKVVIPNTPRNIVWLNDEFTMLGVWMPGAFNIYMFSSSTGWTLTTNIPEPVFSCGRDSLDRIWYATASSKYGSTYCDIHVLTPTLPVSIIISPELNSYSYSGSQINSYINVRALNAAGTTIAAAVKLVIQGSNMTFADSTTIKTVTTLTSGPLQVNTIITGAGFTNIIASVEV